MTAAQLDTLRHMLGINDPWMATPKAYRNYYCANPGDADLHALMWLGMVELYRTDSYEWFRCTPQGERAAMESHRTIRRKKSERVYMKFLEVSDACPDLTFKQFLTEADFAECRRSA